MMVHVGLNNFLSTEKIMAVKKYTHGSRVSQKLISESKVINMAGQNKTRSLIMLTGDIIVRSILTPETLVDRMGRVVDLEYTSMLGKEEVERSQEKNDESKAILTEKE